MAATQQLDLGITIRDPAIASSVVSPRIRDLAATTHDYVDPTPRSVATAGVPGTAFVQLETSVQQIERIVVDVPPGADLVMRFGGAVALLLGTAVNPALVGGETLQLGVDADASVTTTFQAGDTTLALVAKRINYAHGAPIASVDLLGRLQLLGLRTGDAGAWAKGWSFGRLRVVGGTALTALGLVVGDTYGRGDDQDVGPGLFAKTFPSRALPRRLELSGSAQGAKFWLAGKAA